MTPLQWGLGAAAFATERGFWVAFGVVGWRAMRPRGKGPAAAASVLLLVVSIGVWALWMSPNADSRLALWRRVAAASGLLALAAAGLAAVGLSRWGLALGGLGILVMVVAQPLLDD